jgi:MFS family permease
MNFQIFNATMATEVFGKGAEEFGLLGTIMAIGTLAGALMAARRATPTLRTILLALTGFAVSTLALTFAPNYVVYSLLLIPSGFFALTVMTTANAAVQMGSAPEYRGRVMSIYVAIFLGGTPLGAPAIGWLGEVLGPRASVLIAAVATGLTVLGVLAYFRWHDGLRIHLERAPLRLATTRAA